MRYSTIDIFSFHSSSVSLVVSETSQWHGVIRLQLAQGARTSMKTRRTSSSIVFAGFVMLCVFSDRTCDSSAMSLHINQRNAKEAVLVGKGRAHEVSIPGSAGEAQ